MNETGIIVIEFNGVSNFICPVYKINSDEIIQVEIEENNLYITLFSDLINDYSKITICAKSVNVMQH